MSKAASAEQTTHQFEAEVSQVLRLVINSLYSNKEIFLRELISNASDALDKLRFGSLTEPGLLPEGESLCVRLIPDDKAGTLTIWDDGIGMTREELIGHLGTVAKSGSREFLEKVKAAQQGDVNIIGQFGVGFYSAWLVADRVTVVSRAAGQEDAWQWSSDARETFTLAPAERTPQGTSVTLHLTEDHKDYLQEWKLRELVQRYSDYLNWPIELQVQREEGEEGKKETVTRFEAINRGSALWQRSPTEIEESQYEEFYKHLAHDWEAPLAHRHARIEGKQEFAALLFLPRRPPFDLFSPDHKHGVRLYVRRVFIMDDCQELLPRWLRFVRGVVDSEDLPLNVSRETLQDSTIVRSIRKQVVKQVLDMLQRLAADKSEDYTLFWNAFGSVLKEGLHFEPDARDRLLPLLRYESSKEEGLVSLKEYCARMPEEQNAIYYALGESHKQLEASPHLEALRKRGFEVLYMVDPVDQWAVAGLDEYEGHKFVSATAADLELGDSSEEETKAHEQADADLRALRDRIRVRLQDHIGDVRTSTRLTDSPACLVIPEGGLQPHIERMLRAMPQANVPESKRVLEINPDHPVIQNLNALVKSEWNSEQVDAWIDLLYDQSLLTEGSPVQDPNAFAQRVTSLLREASARAAAPAE